MQDVSCTRSVTVPLPPFRLGHLLSKEFQTCFIISVASLGMHFTLLFEFKLLWVRLFSVWRKEVLCAEISADFSICL